jgi:hypothetical protein
MFQNTPHSEFIILQRECYGTKRSQGNANQQSVEVYFKPELTYHAEMWTFNKEKQKKYRSSLCMKCFRSIVENHKGVGRVQSLEI